MIVRIIIVGFMILGMQVTPSFAGAEEKGYSEHLTSQYLIRISSGPGEAESMGSYALRIFEPEGLDLIAGAIQPRDGFIVKSWAVESSKKRAVTIFIWTCVVGSGSYGTLEVFTFDGKRFRPFNLPPAHAALLDGCMGHDVFDVADDMIYWQFPLYLPEDSNANPTGGERCLELKMGKKTWKLSDHRIVNDFVTP